MRCAASDVWRRSETSSYDRMAPEIGRFFGMIIAMLCDDHAPKTADVSPVTDLTFGSGIDFESRGVRELKGVPGGWELFTVR